MMHSLFLSGSQLPFVCKLHSVNFVKYNWINTFSHSFHTIDFVIQQTNKQTNKWFFTRSPSVKGLYDLIFK